MTRRTDKRIVVWGGGSWGTALAVHLARRADRVAVWVYDQGQYETMAATRGNPDFLPGVALPENMDLFHGASELPYQGDLWLSITPTQYLRDLWKEIGPHLEKNTIVVSASKGIENGTLLLPSEIIESFTGAGDVVALSARASPGTSSTATRPRWYSPPPAPGTRGRRRSSFPSITSGVTTPPTAKASSSEAR